MDPQHVEAVGAVRGELYVRHALLERADRPVVVFDDEHDGQVVDGGEVQGFEKPTLIDGALAEIGDGDAVGVTLFGREAGPATGGHPVR